MTKKRKRTSECDDCPYCWKDEGDDRATPHCEPNGWGECPCEEEARHQREDAEREAVIKEYEQYL